jgi:hypothetical protein
MKIVPLSITSLDSPPPVVFNETLSVKEGIKSEPLAKDISDKTDTTAKYTFIRLQLLLLFIIILIFHSIVSIATSIKHNVTTTSVRKSSDGGREHNSLRVC